MDEVNVKVPIDWPFYTHPHLRFSLRYPPGWEIQQSGPDTTAFRAPGDHAALSITFSAADCDAAASRLRARRLNYYLVGESYRSIANREAATFQFRDTVSNLREYRAFISVERGCCEVKWSRSERSEGLEFEPTLEKIVSTLEMLTGK